VSSAPVVSHALPSLTRLVTAAFFTLAAWAVVACALWPVYRALPFVVLAAVAILAGALTATVGAVLRWATWGVALASIVVLAIIGVPLAVPDRTVNGVVPELAGLRELAVGALLGWRQLLTIDLPVGSYQSLLVPALVLLFGGSVSTLLVAVRARRPALAAIVPALGFALAVAMGRDDASVAAGVTVALVAVLMLWMSVMRRQRRADSLRAGGAAPTATNRGAVVRSMASTVVIITIAASAGALAAALAPSNERTVLRSLVERPFDPRSLPSPLSAYRAAFSPDIADDTVMRVIGAPEDARVRLAVLDSYDGVVFAVGSGAVSAASGSFARVASQRDVTEGGVASTVRFELLRSPGVWLPTVGDLRSVSFLGENSADVRDRVRVNASTRTAVIVGGVAPGTAYDLEVVTPEPSDITLSQLISGGAAVPGITAVPDELRGWLSGVTTGIEGDGARLAAAVRALAQQGYVSHGIGPDEPSTRSGHSIDRITELFTRRPMLGDAEQYAVAAALMARELGFPSRVVLGYGPLSTEVAELSSRDLTAWIEVNTATDGWVAIDVVPPAREVPPAEPRDPVPIARPQNAVQPPAEAPPVTDEQAPPVIELNDPVEDDTFAAMLLLVVRLAGIALLAAALLAAPFVGVVAAKASRRRRRRRAKDPALRILGGWRELTDSATDHGLRIPVGATRREAARALTHPQANVLARVADRVDFAPEAADAREADRVWMAVDSARADLAAQQGRRQRWRASLSARSLRRYH
jgi:hypothetical protein